MDAMIYNPLQEYDSKFRVLHLEKAKSHFETLVRQSGVNVEENRKTVREHDTLKESISAVKRKLTWWNVLRVIMCITLILIPLVILTITPKIKALRAEIEQADKKIEELLALAQRQMAPLNALFTDRDAIRLIEATLPLISFSDCFSVEQEANMRVNYDFTDHDDPEQSTVDVLAGSYNENPFLFESKLIHKMGIETYHGYKTIYWTETYRDSEGKMRTRTRSQTLHASLTKPKPFYHSRVCLSYCAQGCPELSFTRDATNLDRKSDKSIDRHVKRGEKKLKRMTDRAIKENRDFTSMSNSDFEVLFDALDRTDEVQFRTLFTPLAQTNMVELIRSQSGYGDDFHFIKKKRTNRIVSQHSQGRTVTLLPSAYYSYSFDRIKDNFINGNADYFKAVYFDFAPLWAIPMYQERPVHSLKPIADCAQRYADKECETLANAINAQYVVHPQTKTQAILKSSFVKSEKEIDEIRIAAYSYDIIPRLDIVPVMGGDGHLHGVPVQWDDYIPLETSNRFFVADEALTRGRNVVASRNGICIFN